MSYPIVYLLVNFGGPRDLEEIRPFLTELLWDRDVVRTNFPTVLHRYLFGKVARKRALQIRVDYELIGGRSPIYFDTEAIARQLSAKLSAPVITLHRYLPATHERTLQQLRAIQAGEIRVVPCFPQFSYATTGSIARFLSERLSPKILSSLRWVRSYAGHLAFISAYERRIREFLNCSQIADEEAILLFSCHSLPRVFVNTGDSYESECTLSYQLLTKRFAGTACQLAYQSKFGKGEWLRPYTDEVCANFPVWSACRKKVVVVPLSFTSDHIETLFEIEYIYLPMLRARGAEAYRCPALNLEPYWLDAIAEIAGTSFLCSTGELIRR